MQQALTPNALLGRMNASYRFVSWGVVPLGALLGGGLGDAIGLRPTLFIGAGGIFAAALWIVLSPVRGIRQLPGASEGPVPPEPLSEVDGTRQALPDAGAITVQATGGGIGMDGGTGDAGPEIQRPMGAGAGQGERRDH